MSYCLVAINGPFANSILTYREVELDSKLVPGMFVEVPLGKRVIKGCILKIGIENPQLPENLELKDVRDVKAEYNLGFTLSSKMLSFLTWMSDYYHYPLGMLLFDILPKPLKRPRELSFSDGKGSEFEFELNQTQKEIVGKILKKNLIKSFQKWLLHGVTGSGKTAVYISIVKEILKEGKSVLFLLPEINLTPQFIKTFIKYLPVPIYSYNSTISNSDRWGLWKFLSEDSSPKIIIGVRSAIFLPIQKLGLIVVDEEHDASFKQGDHCTYNARDMALKKGALEDIPVVLGSATPSVETFHQFKERDCYLKMRERVGNSVLPEIELVDIRKENYKEHWPLANVSVKEIDISLKRGEQVIVFVNRLGYATYLQCRSCGYTFTCPNCSLNLKFFQKRGTISCQHCEYKDVAPEICPECSNLKILRKGFGTEKVEEVLKDLFPEKTVGRFDRDVVTTMTKLENTLNSFHQGDTDILVGTQMVSKGHNFKNVNLVVILGIDSQLNFPDFRANERVFQLLTQVSGRSGRYSDKSKVLVQSLNPENPLFQLAKSHSFDGIYSDELSLREMCNCPPFSKIVMIYITSRSKDRVSSTSNNLVKVLNNLKFNHFKTLEILGPRPSSIEKRVNKFSWSVMLKSSNLNDLHNAINTVRYKFQLNSTVSIKYDIDPYHIS